MVKVAISSGNGPAHHKGGTVSLLAREAPSAPTVTAPAPGTASPRPSHARAHSLDESMRLAESGAPRLAPPPEGKARPSEPLRTARPRVTVVVPCKNRAHYLPATLESILAQDYPELECIVVDAASTDGTLELLRAYELRGVRWVSEPDAGAFEAIARGWAMGTGAILAWLNADDTWEPGAVSTAVAAFEANPGAAVVHGACGLMDDSGRVSQLVVARHFTLAASLVYCDHIIMQSASFMSRAAVDAAGGLYPAWTHDQELWLTIATTGGEFVAIPEHLANVRDVRGHIHTVPRIMIPARVAMMHRYFARPDVPPELYGERGRTLSNTYLRGFDLLRPSYPPHWRWAVICFVRAIAECPSNTPFVLRGIGSRALHRFDRVYWAFATARGIARGYLGAILRR